MHEINLRFYNMRIVLIDIFRYLIINKYFNSLISILPWSSLINFNQVLFTYVIFSKLYYSFKKRRKELLKMLFSNEKLFKMFWDRKLAKRF